MTELIWQWSTPAPESSDWRHLSNSCGRARALGRPSGGRISIAAGPWRQHGGGRRTARCAPTASLPRPSPRGSFWALADGCADGLHRLVRLLPAARGGQVRQHPRCAIRVDPSQRGQQPMPVGMGAGSAEGSGFATATFATPQDQIGCMLALGRTRAHARAHSHPRRRRATRDSTAPPRSLHLFSLPSSSSRWTSVTQWRGSEGRWGQRRRVGAGAARPR